MENLDVQIFCENLSANAIISYYIDRAKGLHIATDVKTSIPKNIQIENIDLNVVLGNCLENAIEACAKLSDETQRFLNVKAAIVNEYLVLNIKNSFNGIANINDGILHTTKVDSKNHGIGLENVRTIVRQYEGTINLNYSENKFETSIIMRNAI
jgi:sensor histidine kinase regulating citrate/malate metabolism